MTRYRLPRSSRDEMRDLYAKYGDDRERICEEMAKAAARGEVVHVSNVEDEGWRAYAGSLLTSGKRDKWIYKSSSVGTRLSVAGNTLWSDGWRRMEELNGLIHGMEWFRVYDYLERVYDHLSRPEKMHLNREAAMAKRHHRSKAK